MPHGGHLIRSTSTTQSNIALSRAEAELYAMTNGASEGLGAKAMCSDFGTPMEVFLHIDASAAIGVAQRKGLGRIRHLETQSLWIQDAVRERRVNLFKVPGTENPADLMTKSLDARTQDKLMGKLGLEILEGRPASAPELTTSFAQGVGCDDETVDALCVADSLEVREVETRSGNDKVCIDQENIADGNPSSEEGAPCSGNDKVCIDQSNIVDGGLTFEEGTLGR